MKNYILFFFAVLLFFSGFINKENPLRDYFIIPISIDGVTYNFLFDNGADVTVLFGDKGGRVKTTKVTIYDADHNSTNAEFSKKKLSINLLNQGKKLKSKIVLVEKGPSILVENGVDGILGRDIISRFDWKIDFNNKSLSIIDKNSIDKLNDKLHFELFVEDNVIIKNIQLSDSTTIDFKSVFLDFGYSGFLQLKDTSFTSEANDLMYVSVTQSVAGEQLDSTWIRSCNMHLGNFKMTDVPVFFDNERGKSVVGCKFLRNFGVVYLLYSENRVHLNFNDKFTHTFISPFIYKEKVMSYVESSSNSEYDLEIYSIYQDVNIDTIKTDTLKWNIQVIKNNK